MGKLQRVIVIGGGLAGVSALYELSKRGIRAELFEARDSLAEGASFANGGLITPSMSDPWNNPGLLKSVLASIASSSAPLRFTVPGLLTHMGWVMRFLAHANQKSYEAAIAANFKLAELSLRITGQIRDELGLNIDWSRAGTLKLFRSKSALKKYLSLAHQLDRYGLLFEPLSAGEVCDREPALARSAEEICGGIYFPDDCSGNARMYTILLGAECARQGAQLHFNSAVLEIFASNGRVIGVRTERGVEHCSDVVLTAGVGTPRLTSPLGIAVGIGAVKGYSLTYHAESAGCLPRLPIVDDAAHAVAVPLGRRLRIAGFAELDGYDLRIPRARVVALQRFFRRLLPDLATSLEWRGFDAWAGLRPVTPRGTPYIGKSKLEGLWLNAGHGHLGWTLAAGSARLLANVMAGEKAEIDPLPYRAPN